jgi:hypothetical protein
MRLSVGSRSLANGNNVLTIKYGTHSDQGLLPILKNGITYYVYV